MTKTPETSPNQYIQTITPDTGDERPKIDWEMSYLKNNNIDKVVHQKLRNKDVYENDVHKMYTIIMGQTN